MSSRSEVWNYFMKLDYQEAQCKICHAVLQNKGSTSSLWGHLRARHVTVKTSNDQLEIVDKYSGPIGREREPLSSDIINPESSEIKIDEDVCLDEKSWNLPVNLESVEDPSQESLSEKCLAKPMNDHQQIKISGVTTRTNEVQSYLIRRLTDAERKFTEIDEDESFCRIVVAALKRLSPKKSAEVKIKIMQILFEAQYGDNKENHEMNQDL